MKKLCLMMIFSVFLCFFSYGQSQPGPQGGTEAKGQGSSVDTSVQEEIDFLLFLPNSGNQFVNQDQARVQLDKLAKYLAGRNLIPGQIAVYGYSAAASNNIEPVNLSKDRAFFVIGELQKRGVPKELFSDPVGYGEVNLWGGNTNEQNRSPNRRVRILVDGTVLTPSTLKAAEPEPVVSSADSNEKPAAQAQTTDESGFRIPWEILLPLLIIALIALIVFLLARSRRRSRAAAAPEPVPAAVPVVAVVPAAVSYTTVNLDEEIRLRAYGLYEERNGQNGDADGDWYKAVVEICGKYEAAGYGTYAETGSWWARKRL